MGFFMCESLILDRKTGKAIEIKRDVHQLVYTGTIGGSSVLLEGFYMEGIINYASLHEIKESHGVKRGYMFIVGECEK